jgi:hypothetical protein
MKSDFNGQNSCAGLLPNVDGAFLRGNDAELREKKPRADDGMSREAQFILRSEDAQTRESFGVRGLLHKNCFAEIHFARDVEHAARGKSVAIDDDSKRIAGKWRVGENVELVKASLHNFLRLRNSAFMNNIPDYDF